MRAGYCPNFKRKDVAKRIENVGNTAKTEKKNAETEESIVKIRNDEDGGRINEREIENKMKQKHGGSVFVDATSFLTISHMLTH